MITLKFGPSFNDEKIDVQERLGGLLFSNFGGVGDFVYIPGLQYRNLFDYMADHYEGAGEFTFDALKHYIDIWKKSLIVGNVKEENTVVEMLVKLLFVEE